MKHWLTLLLAVATLLSARADFFKADRDLGAALPADKVYPEGRLFPISGFSPPAGADLRKLGYSLAGPVYGGNEQMKEFALKQAKANMPVIWQLEVLYKGQPMSIKRNDEMAKNKEEIDWNEMDRAMTAAVAEALECADGNIAYWAVTPEELRYWRKDEIEYLRRFTALIRKMDAKKRPIWMYIPGHYGQEALAQYTPLLDVLAQGYYPQAGKNPRVWGRLHSENIRSAALKSDNKNLITGVVPEMYIQPKDDELDMIPVWVRNDVYIPLIYGGKFVVIFSLAQRRNFEEHGAYFFAYSKLARTLTRPGGLGEVLLFGEPKEDLKLTVTAGEPEVEYQRKDKEGKVVFSKKYPTLATRELLHVSGRFLFAGSSAPEAVKAKLTGLPRQPVTVFDAEADRELGQTDNGEFELNFTPYEVKVLRFAPR